MELSRRDFMRSTAAFTAVASVLGTSGIAFAQDADQNCLVRWTARCNALAKRFKAGSAAGWSTMPTTLAVTPLPAGEAAPDRFSPRWTVCDWQRSLPPTAVPPSTFLTK